MTLRGSSGLNTWLCSWDMKKQACRWRLVSADLISHQKALLFSERQKQMSKCKLSTWAFKDSKTFIEPAEKKVNSITKVPEGEAQSKLYLIYSPFLSRFRSLWNLIKLYRGLRSFQVLDDHFGLYVLYNMRFPSMKGFVRLHKFISSQWKQIKHFKIRCMTKKSNYKIFFIKYL